MTSEKFKRQLREEAKKWQEENLIDQSFYQQLAQRYEFEELENSAKNRFVMVLIGIGSTLLGLAVITFVAANWDGLTKTMKVGTLLGFFLVINSAGFYFWNNAKQGLKYRLGSGLLLLGSLVLGANLGLMSQLFHQSKPTYELYLVWAIAIIFMAYSLKISTLGIVTIILLQIAYSLSISYVDSFYFPSFILELILNYFPLFLAVVLIPLAYRCKSQWLFTLTALLMVESYGVNLMIKGEDLLDSSHLVASFFAVNFTCFVPAFFWAYRDNLWRKNLDDSSSFAVIARKLAVFFMALVFYIFSFQGTWLNSFTPSYQTWTIHDYLVYLEPIILLILTIFLWWRLRITEAQESTDKQMTLWGLDLSSIVVAFMLIFTAFLLTYHLTIAPIRIWGVLFFNMLLGILSFGLIRESLQEGKRFRFWSGIILIVLQIFTRMIEYDTDLLFKALVFFLCGIGIITAGLWFEKNVRVISR